MELCGNARRANLGCPTKYYYNGNWLWSLGSLWGEIRITPFISPLLRGHRKSFALLREISFESPQANADKVDSSS